MVLSARRTIDEQLSPRAGLARDRALRAGKGLKTYDPVLHGIDQFRE